MAMAGLAQEVKTRPIIFGAESVRAILSGTKTQTRRAVKPQPDAEGFFPERNEDGLHLWCVRDSFVAGRCPYGQPGDRLWVREAFALESNYNIEGESRYPPPHNDGRPVRRVSDAETAYWEQCHYRATDPTPELCCEHEACDGGEPCQRIWKSPLFLPRWASRTTLELTEVRVERLQEITEADALAEGVRLVRDGGGTYAGRKGPGKLVTPWPSAREAYADAWNALNEARGFGWDTNCWVWVLSFKRITPPQHPGAQPSPPAAAARD